MTTQISGDTGVSQCQANSVSLGDIQSGALVETGSAAIGYGTGAGGSVTQATSKSTAVTLNKPTGQITMNSAALAAGATVQFQLNNSLIQATDTVIVNPLWGAVVGYNYSVKVTVAVGAAIIKVTNDTAGSLSEALVLNFSVVKGASA